MSTTQGKGKDIQWGMVGTVELLLKGSLQWYVRMLENFVQTWALASASMHEFGVVVETIWFTSYIYTSSCMC